MKIAIYQGPGVFLDVAANLALLDRLAKSAATQDAGLLILPEMFLTGYNIGDEVGRLAEPARGPSAERAATIARDNRISLLYGYPERAGRSIYNSALLIDDAGRALANYRKTHLFGPEERRLFRPGEDLAVARLAGLTIGILICYDIEFPELVRSLVLKGADMVAVPTALSPPYDEIPTSILRARAYENQIFVAYSNHSGTEGDLSFIGGSALVGPDGRDIVRAGRDEETLLIASADLARYAESRRLNTYLQDRRPELYGAVVTAQDGDTADSQARMPQSESKRRIR
jgi:predicted amidohydrolase